jgi:ABC-type glycerol-3-phosphate transport system permease component
MALARRRQSVGDWVFNIFNYLVLLIFTAACLYPFYYIFLYSISDATEAARGSVFLWPVKPEVASYASLLAKPEVLNAVFVSVARTVVGTVLTVLCSSYLAYAVTRRDLPLRSLIYRFVVLTLYIGAGLIPWYMTMKGLGLKNNFLLYVLPGAVGAFYVILVKTYIEQLPSSLEESAKIDGAGPFTIFFRIIAPISLPIIATVTIFSAVGQWNTWQDNLYLVNVRSLQTLQLLLYNYLNTSVATGDVSRMSTMSLIANVKQVSATSLRMTMSMITVFPILLVYPFMQRYFIKGIMLGAIKG